MLTSPAVLALFATSRRDARRARTGAALAGGPRTARRPPLPGRPPDGLANTLRTLPPEDT